MSTDHTNGHSSTPRHQPRVREQASLDAIGNVPPAAGTMSVQRVRKAYEQVSDQLRHLIITGELVPGDRLPNESLLAKEFGVSRATVREALRILSAQRLILSTKGARGGTYVATPQLELISEFMQANLSLLTEMQHISLDELLEAREHLEVNAARQAALRRDSTDLERLHASVPNVREAMSKEERFSFNINFHALLMEVAGNRLLYISALPVFTVLQTNLARSELSASWHKEVTRQHDGIADAVKSQDGDAAAQLMKAHIGFLRPSYERAWRRVVRPRSARGNLS